jgi:tRNA-guanine family transglycosylase
LVKANDKGADPLAAATLLDAVNRAYGLNINTSDLRKKKKRIGEDGVHFRHELTGDEIFLGPKEAMQIENDLGADIIMAFDECIPYPTTENYAAKSIKKTIRWAENCLKYHSREDQALFGIVQGGIYNNLRRECADALTGMDFPGYAIGGLSVGHNSQGFGHNGGSRFHCVRMGFRAHPYSTDLSC